MFTTIISKTQIDSEVAHVETKSKSRTRWVDNVSFTVESVRFDRIKLKGRMLYAVRCWKSNEDMILALAGQFKQLSHEPEKFR